MTTVNDVADNMLKAARAYDAAAANELANADTPSLEALAYRLRHPETWPKGFKWYFGDCTSCAMGLAHELWAPDKLKKWRESERDTPWASSTATMLDMPYSSVDRIFMNAGHSYGVCFAGQIRPEMVADQIDAFLKRRCKLQVAKARRAAKKESAHV